ncbi:hypothetical protein N7488_008541 [Penicillium malachiteum]|nr:hypothetical protein N7488_008541 [Penicillium malachiteum]
MTIFQPTLWTSSTPLGEIDFLGHKSNSTYLTDFDATRAYHISSLLRTGFHMWSERQLWPVLAGVQCIFRQPISPGQKYDIITRIVAWDDKSFYLLSHFVKKDSFVPSQLSDKSRLSSARSLPANENLQTDDDHGNESRKQVLALALARMVLKSGQETVVPSLFFQDCGLLPSQSIPRRVSGALRNLPFLTDDPKSSSISTAFGSEKEKEDLLATIESRRARGLLMAQNMNSLNEGIEFFDVNEREAYSKF